MPIKTLFATLAPASFLFCATTAAATQPAPARYDVVARLDPVEGTIDARATMNNLRCQGDRILLHLNRAFTIREASVDGIAVIPQYDPAGAPKFWVSAARTFSLPCPRQRLTISYDGGGPITADNRNQISPAVIELALYSAWFPISELDVPIDWQLDLTLPGNRDLASNGVLVARRRHAGTTTFVLRSERPTNDIAVIALANPLTRSAARGGLRARVSMPDTAPKTAKMRAGGLAETGLRALAFYRQRLGAPIDPRGLTDNRLIFSPRSGPLSYARLPIIVTPLTYLTGEETGARELGFNLRHEYAHFWWGRAAGPDDDWINEGFAEFAALLATRDADGQARYEALLSDYRATSRDADGVAPVYDPAAASGRPSNDYVTKYVRPVLLLDRLMRDYGIQAMNDLLRAMHESGADGGQTTAKTEAIVAARLGTAAAAKVSQCIRALSWSVDCGG